MDPFAAHTATPAELVERHAAERRGQPFLELIDGEGRRRFTALAERRALTIGRDAESDIALGWDPQVSRSHVELQKIGAAWTVIDDGLSRNGTFVNGERIGGRRRLVELDVVRVGQTLIVFRDPAGLADETAPASGAEGVVELTPAQRRVLIELCRPNATDRELATPASNGEIAAALTLSLDGVRSQMKSLFERFGVEHLAQNEKRAELVRRAFALGIVNRRELSEPRADDVGGE
jgi:pSer/pThr/pTyr-binding forkhead associated (FHA) protein